MNASGILGRVWWWVRWPFWILVAAFVAFIALGIYLNYEKDITGKAVTQINSRKLTLADVEGKNLPPMPDQAENDATVAGIDKNNNGIRDDVELAIFKKYPDSAKIRVAELQYAMDIQTQLTLVFNSDSWIASQKSNRGFDCLIDVAFDKYSDIHDQIAKSGEWGKEVQTLALNTDVRKNKWLEIKKLETDYTPVSKTCNVDLSKLQN